MRQLPHRAMAVLFATCLLASPRARNRSGLAGELRCLDKMVLSERAADHPFCISTRVRNWHKADIDFDAEHVRFRGQSGHL